MIRSIVIATTVILFFFVYGFYVSQADLGIVPTQIELDHPKGFYDYRGVLNVQSNLSQGSSSPSEIVEEAQRADLDFLILTDVNQLNPAFPLNGYVGSTLVMTEAEYSFLDARILYIGEKGLRSFADTSELNLHLTDLLSRPSEEVSEGLSIMAHPFVQGRPTWAGSFPPGIRGLEIINPKSIASRAFEQSKIDILWSSLFYFFNSRYAFLRLFREPHEETALWDVESSNRPLWGFAGANANARAIPLADWLVKFPSYQKSFEMASNHVLLESELTGNYQKDRAKLLKALRAGQFYFSVDLLGNPKGFNFTLEDGESRFLMGHRMRLKPGLRLLAELGREPDCFYEMVLFKDGVREMTSNTSKLDYSVKEPGVYRLVVRVSPLLPLPDAKKWITWIYSNPFFIQQN